MRAMEHELARPGISISYIEHVLAPDFPMTLVFAGTLMTSLPVIVPETSITPPAARAVLRAVRVVTVTTVAEPPPEVLYYNLSPADISDHPINPHEIKHVPSAITDRSLVAGSRTLLDERVGIDSAKSEEKDDDRCKLHVEG